MNPDDFSSNAPGTIVRHPNGYRAFVPRPLPPADLPFSWELASRLSEADRAVAQLAGIARALPNVRLLVAPFVRREAVLSSRIEGTRAGVTEIARYEAGAGGDDSAAAQADTQEVVNYIHALEHGLARLDVLPISLRLVREIHEKLMQGARGEHLTPGQFRRSQNWIGRPGSTLNDATYVPSPIEEMGEALARWEAFLHDEATPLPPLVRLALIHYQFEAIHPFLDGNGRVGRLLISLLLSAWGLLPEPLLYLSAWFEENRSDYYRLLLGVSQKGEWEAWVEFFLAGVTAQGKDAVQRSERLMALWQDYRNRLQTARSSGLALSLLDTLMASPATTMQKVAHDLSVTPRTAQQVIRQLIEAGILTETTGKKRGRVYVAADIIAIVEAATSPFALQVPS